MKIAILLPIIVVLASCSAQSDIETVIRDRLTDPESAKFKDLIVSESGNYACIVWNSKNKLGGYGDWDIAEMKKSDGAWTAINIQGNPSNCTPENLKFKDTFDRVRESLRKENKG